MQDFGVDHRLSGATLQVLLSNTRLAAATGKGGITAGYHPPEEEYLATIRDMQEDGMAVIRARLAERLGYSAPTVSEMVRRLVKSGLVEIATDKSILLTPEGRTRAESVVRRHRLAERLLTDILGLEWHLVHEEAARWEHVISDVVEERLVAVLGSPETCPHGNPIPGLGESRTDLVALSETSAGATVTIARVTETIEVNLDLIRYLSEHNVTPGTTVEIGDVSPDGTVTLAVGGAPVSIGADAAKSLFVKENPTQPSPRPR